MTEIKSEPNMREINPQYPVSAGVPYCLSNFPSSEFISLLLQHLAENHAYTSICLNWNIIGFGSGKKSLQPYLKLPLICAQGVCKLVFQHVQACAWASMCCYK